MKGKSLFLTAAALSLVLSILACITSTPTPNNPPAPPATNPPAPVVPTDTLAPTATEVPTDTEQPPLPTLGPGPSQPSAPPHFHAGEIIKLTQVKMISTTKGWGLVGAYVLTTSDGGHTWKEVTPPQSFTDPTKGKAYGIFLDEKTAWVIFSENDQIAPEASVWSTTDGGQTWTPSAPLMHQVNAEVLWGEFAAHGTQSGWLLLRGVYMGAGTHYVAQLFHTADGGQTWTDLQPSLDLNYDMTSMVFADGQNGWLAWQTTGAYGPGAPDYAVTGDGGASWNSLELPAPPEAPNLFSDYDYA